MMRNFELYARGRKSKHYSCAALLEYDDAVDAQSKYLAAVKRWWGRNNKLPLCEDALLRWDNGIILPITVKLVDNPTIEVAATYA